MHPGMKVLAWRVSSIALLCWALEPMTALAHPTYLQQKIPNGPALLTKYPMPMACMLCHDRNPADTSCTGAELCLNPFGTKFRMDMPAYTWAPTLSALDMDGDGFSAGAELQDPLGSWQAGSAAPGTAARVTAPFDANDSPGLHDDDHDHYCWFGHDTSGDFKCTGGGEQAISDLDCNDADAVISSGTAEACDGKDNDCDGIFDEDLTGCCAAGQAVDTLGICRPKASIDGDGDGFCLSGRDRNGNRNCIDAGEQTPPYDCNDANPSISPVATESCIDGIDNDCDNATDIADDACVGYVDSDGDGFCPEGRDMSVPRDGDCRDSGELSVSTSGRDCDDTKQSVFPGAMESCLNAVDDDCDGRLDGHDEDCRNYFDADSDGYCPQGIDRNADHDCDDSNEQTGTGDCDDTLASVHPNKPEDCGDGRDNDCDGATDLKDSDCNRDRDKDGDGYCPLGVDNNHDGDCLDSGEDVSSIDCDDTEAAIHPGVHESSITSCRDDKDNDCDGTIDAEDSDCVAWLDHDKDTYCPNGRDVTGDGDCLDIDEDRAVHDCSDDNADIHPGIEEDCGDGLDNDCNGFIDDADALCGGASVKDPGELIPDSGGVNAHPSASDGTAGAEPRLTDPGCGCRATGAHSATHDHAAWLTLCVALVVTMLRRARRSV
jgi:hypothetical protein